MPANLADFSPPTDAQMRTTWQRLRNETWPQTFEECMQDPVLSRLIYMNAKHQPQPPLRVVRHPWPFMAKPYVPQAPARPVVFDMKRAAAGDRDD
jgi:hypothetical protein